MPLHTREPGSIYAVRGLAFLKELKRPLRLSADIPIVVLADDDMRNVHSLQADFGRAQLLRRVPSEDGQVLFQVRRGTADLDIVAKVLIPDPLPQRQLPTSVRMDDVGSRIRLPVSDDEPLFHHRPLHLHAPFFVFVKINPDCHQWPRASPLLIRLPSSSNE